MVKKIMLGILIFICMGGSVQASVIDDDYAEIQKVIDSMNDTGEKITFSEIVGQLMSGNLSLSFQSLGQYFMQKVFYEINVNKNAIIQIIGVAIIGAVFTNFSMAFAKTSVAETGFYLTYMILFTLLTASFVTASQIASSVMNQMLEFMQALVPAFCLAMTFATGVSTSTVYYQFMIILIGVVDWIMCKIIFNLINIYIILKLVNNLSKEDYISKMADLFKTVIKWSLKTIMATVLGLNLIQGMILPAFDTVKSSLILKASTVIPGVGNALNAAAKAAIGSGVLIKNAVGVGGLVVLLIICVVPLVKLVVISFMYKVAEAVIQPVSDARIVKCLHVASEGISLLISALGTVVFLFVLSLAIITASTNMQLGG